MREVLEAGVIHRNTNPYLFMVVMILNKNGEWCMCPNFRALNNLIIKDKFPIPVVDDLLDILHGSIFFTNLDIRLGYHQIQMKENDIPKTTF